MTLFMASYKTIYDHNDVVNTTITPQPFYGPFSGNTQVSRSQKRISELYGARED